MIKTANRHRGWSQSATSRQPMPRNAATLRCKRQTRQCDSNRAISGKPGAVRLDANGCAVLQDLLDLRLVLIGRVHEPHKNIDGLRREVITLRFKRTAVPPRSDRALRRSAEPAEPGRVCLVADSSCPTVGVPARECLSEDSDRRRVLCIKYPRAARAAQRPWTH
jgi:hypothetical protein